jgi:hypothetical protein
MSSLQLAAASLIARKGRSVTLTKRTGTTYSTSTGAASNTTANHTFNALVLAYSNRERDGTVIQAGDRKIVLTGKSAGAVPEAGDTVTVGSVVFRLVDVQVVAEQTDNLVFTCQGRR